MGSEITKNSSNYYEVKQKSYNSYAASNIKQSPALDYNSPENIIVDRITGKYKIIKRDFIKVDKVYLSSNLFSSNIDIHLEGAPLYNNVSVAESKKAYSKKCAGLNSLLKAPFVNISNKFWSSGIIVVDMDYEDSEERLMLALNSNHIPFPDYYIKNSANGHIQVGWLYDPFPIDLEVYRRHKHKTKHNMTSKAKSQLTDKITRQTNVLELVTASLNKQLKGDEHFTRRRFKNPFYCPSDGSVEVYFRADLTKQYDAKTDAVIEDAWDDEYDDEDSTFIQSPKHIVKDKILRRNITGYYKYLKTKGTLYNPTSAIRSTALLEKISAVIKSNFNSATETANENGNETFNNNYDKFSDSNNIILNEGERNSGLFRIGIRAAYNNRSIDEAVRQANRTIVSPSLPESEIKSIIASVKREYVKKERGSSNLDSAITVHAPRKKANEKTKVFVSPEFYRILRECGKKGGSKNSVNQIAARRRNLNKAIRVVKYKKLQNRDRILSYIIQSSYNYIRKSFNNSNILIQWDTIKKVASKLQLSESTVSRHLKELSNEISEAYNNFKLNKARRKYNSICDAIEADYKNGKIDQLPDKGEIWDNVKHDFVVSEMRNNMYRFARENYFKHVQGKKRPRRMRVALSEILLLLIHKDMMNAFIRNGSSLGRVALKDYSNIKDPIIVAERMKDEIAKRAKYAISLLWKGKFPLELKN